MIEKVILGVLVVLLLAAAGMALAMGWTLLTEMWAETREKRAKVEEVLPPPDVVEVESIGDANGGIVINRVVFSDGTEYRRVRSGLLRYPDAEAPTGIEESRIRFVGVQFVVRRLWREEDAKRAKSS